MTARSKDAKSKAVKPSRAEAARPARPDPESIAAFLTGEGFRWLSLPNVVSVTVGEKESGGKPTGEMAVKFLVVAKLANPADIVRAQSRPIPDFIDIGGCRIPTDVDEGWPEAHDATSERLARMDPVRGGISIGSQVETGTLGAVVWHKASGRPVALSNWHVLANRAPDRAIFQPGPDEDPASPANLLGVRLERALLDDRIDAAVASIDHRRFDAEIAGLATAVERVMAPTPGMRVVKSGKTTGTTYGIVQEPAVVALGMRGLSEAHSIFVSPIRRDPQRSAGERLSSYGDSGSCWMLVGENGRPTGTMVGLHLAGNGPDLAYACHADEVFSRLGLEPLAGRGAQPVPDLLAPPPEAAPELRPHRVLARSGLVVRGGPGTSFDRVDGRLFGEVVNVVGSEGDWLMVDLQGDGRVDGFMLGALLEPISD